MRILVLGGTGFLSSHVVDAALARGHDVVTVTRGRRDTGPRPGVTALTADRDDASSLGAARHEAFGGDVPDAVVDCCGYTVEGARSAAEVLGDVRRYAYVSSISAYRHWPPGPVRSEDDPLWSHDDDLTEYGPMKAESERILDAALGDRLLRVRAGLIVGPGDKTLRLTSWLQRVATRPAVVAPDALDQPIAVVDARDLAQWVVSAVERGLHGPVNATGPMGMTTLGGLVDACRTAVAATGGRPAEVVVVPEEDLVAAAVEPWRDLPLWMPADVAPTAWDVSTDRARSTGLPSRPVEQTVADTWGWLQHAGLEHPDLPGRLDPARYPRGVVRTG